MRKFLINLSGHPLDTRKWDGFIVRSEKVQIPPEALKKAELLYQYLNNLMFNLFEERDLRTAGERARISILFPGLSQAAIIIVAIYHGRFGHFPKMYWRFRDENGFHMADISDVQSIREKSRIDRTFTV